MNTVSFQRWEIDSSAEAPQPCENPLGLLLSVLFWTMRLLLTKGELEELFGLLRCSHYKLGSH